MTSFQQRSKGPKTSLICFELYLPSHNQIKQDQIYLFCVCRRRTDKDTEEVVTIHKRSFQNIQRSLFPVNAHGLLLLIRFGLGGIERVNLCTTKLQLSRHIKALLPLYVGIIQRGQKQPLCSKRLLKRSRGPMIAFFSPSLVYVVLEVDGKTIEKLLFLNQQ